MRPGFQSHTGLLGDFKLHWMLSFLLYHDRS